MSVAFYERLVQEDCNVGTGLTFKRNPAGGTLAATQIGIHTIGLNQAATTATWNPGNVAVGATVSTTVTVSGALLGDFVFASFNLDLQGLTMTAYVSATSTVTVVLANLTTAAVDLSSGTLKVLVLQSI